MVSRTALYCVRCGGAYGDCTDTLGRVRLYPRGAGRTDILLRIRSGPGAVFYLRGRKSVVPACASSSLDAGERARPERQLSFRIIRAVYASADADGTGGGGYDFGRVGAELSRLFYHGRPLPPVYRGNCLDRPETGRDF